MQQTTLDDIATRLIARLAKPLPGPEAQVRLAPKPTLPGWTPDQAPRTARRAAALLLLYPGPLGPTIPLTLRRADMTQHAGQVSLPGGAVEAGETKEAAALREAEEEIGLESRTVQILGTLSTLWIPQSNYVLTPVVGMMNAEPLFAPHPGEVAAMVELPLVWLGDPTRLKWATRERQGSTIDYPYFDVSGARIWGATAMVLSEFAALFDEET